ncbi:protein FAM169B isoform X2 [Salarias fasciatus]|uniref:Family with sequence similarity 169 member B n=1 Tax=Salarias fasciatus TaxID=181472 RepID=A0A672I2N1_SALFA|nr:protein FAM169B isoform X2 [Salarias fasciatus]
MFPVDLPDVEELTSGSERCLSALESGAVEDQRFGCSQVPVTRGNVFWLQVFEDGPPSSRSVLALRSPDDPDQVLALFLQDSWWSLEDVLRTASPSRTGLVPVASLAERLLVFLLSRVVERLPGEQQLFLLHPRAESCKLLWEGGAAVGFYTFKARGARVDGWSGRCYALPVLDSLQVRRSCRGRGLGLRLLEDFCSTFQEEELLGISSPLSEGLVAVLRKLLGRRRDLRDRLYEVEAPEVLGGGARRNIWLGIQLGRFSPGSAADGGGTPAGVQRNPVLGSSQQVGVSAASREVPGTER